MDQIIQPMFAAVNGWNVLKRKLWSQWKKFQKYSVFQYKLTVLKYYYGLSNIH